MNGFGIGEALLSILLLFNNFLMHIRAENAMCGVCQVKSRLCDFGLFFQEVDLPPHVHHVYTNALPTSFPFSNIPI